MIKTFENRMFSCSMDLDATGAKLMEETEESRNYALL